LWGALVLWGVGCMDDGDLPPEAHAALLLGPDVLPGPPRPWNHVAYGIARSMKYAGWDLEYAVERLARCPWIRSRTKVLPEQFTWTICMRAWAEPARRVTA